MIDWTRLCEHEHLERATIVATSVASMEFPARVVDARGVVVRLEEEDGAASSKGAVTHRGPFSVEVAREHWSELDEVLELILHEQDEFDDRLALIHARSLRWRRCFLLAMIAIVAVLATLGVIRL